MLVDAWQIFDPVRPATFQIVWDFFVPREASLPSVLKENAGGDDDGGEESQDVEYAGSESSYQSFGYLCRFGWSVGSRDEEGVGGGIPMDAESLVGIREGGVAVVLQQFFGNQLPKVRVVGPPLAEIESGLGAEGA